MTLKIRVWRQLGLENLAIQENLTPKEGGPVGNFGIGDIRSFIEHSIVGYNREANALLPRGNQRIDQGLASSEYNRFGSPPEQHRHDLHQARGLGTWLEENELATDHWNEARRYFEAWWRSATYTWTRQEIIRDGLDDYMAMAVLGGVFEDYEHGQESFEAGIDMYEHWITNPKISLKKLLKPRELGYALCRHYLHNAFDREEILQAGRRMLAAKLDNEINCGWLENGQSIRAAMWLMVVYWYPAFHNGETLPEPVEVLLKAYDDMPNVTRPF